MSDVHRLLRPSTHGRAAPLVFDHPLGEALHRLPKVLSTRSVCFGGRDLSLSLKSTKTAPQRNLGTAFKPDVAALLEAAVASPFGKGEETVFDEAVRRGREISAERLSVTDKRDAVLSSIKRSIARDLFPQAKGVSLRFYKLAVYEAGGHFAFHRDTTHADNHHATLLVEVKSAHKGGALVFEADGVELPGIDFSASAEDQLAWIAFYTDVRHKVEPVTEGVRIVLQYDVLVEAATGDAKEEEEDDDEEEEPYLAYNKTVGTATLTDQSQLMRVLAAVNQAFADMEAAAVKANEENEQKKSTSSYSYQKKRDPPTTLSLPLFHLYRTKSILPKYLKNVDRELFFALLETGLYDIALSPIVVQSESDYESGCKYPKDEYSAFLSDPVDKVYTGVDEDGLAVELPVDSEHVFNTAVSQYIVSHREASHLLEHTSYIEYTGNESQPAMYKYFLGAMLLTKKAKQSEEDEMPAKKSRYS